MDRFGIVSMLDGVLQAWYWLPAGALSNPTICHKLVDIVVDPAAIGDQFETQYIVRLENPFFEGIEPIW